MNYLVIGKIIGYIAVLENLFIFSCKKQDNIIRLKLLSDLLWVINFLCLGSITGALLNVVGVARETIFYLKDKNKFASYPFWLPVFILATLISPAIECVNAGRFIAITIIPTIGSVATVLSLYQKNPQTTRNIAFFAQTLWLIYCVALMNIPAAFANGFSLVSALIGTIRNKSNKK